MRKQLLFIFLLVSTCITAQVYTTGTQTLKDNLSVNLDIDATTTTLTLNGPSNAWFAIGFGAVDMSSGADVFRTNGSTITDAVTSGNNLPPADGSQDWNLISNTVSGNTRTIVATRANDTGDSNDYIFSNSAGSFDVIWAYGSSTSYAYHGGANRGATTLGVTLTTNKFNTLNFDVYPNPVVNNVKVQLPTSIESAEVILYDLSGRLIRKKRIAMPGSNELDIADLGSGAYFIRVSSDDKIGSKMIIKQ